MEERACCEVEHELRVKQLQEQMTQIQLWMEKSQTREEERIEKADRREQLTPTKFPETLLLPHV